MRRLFTAVLLTSVFLPRLARADAEIVLDGAAPEGQPDHFFLPFDVPAGTAEIEIQHLGTAKDNVLDFGLNDPAGFRGWGGGNKEPAIVGVSAASRSYLAGPLPAGTWKVVVGKAQIKTTPATFAVKVILRDAPSLAAETRKPYAPVAALATEARFYAGDFHTHSRDSGDARPPLEELATFARGRGLDFAEVSDHNTISQLDFFNDVQAAHPDFLLVPGIEYTTYAGHGNAIGATSWFDHKIGQPGVTVPGAVAAIHQSGALFGVNHPALDVGDLCIGCAWRHDLDVTQIDTVEVSTGKADSLFGAETIAYWEKILDAGSHAAAIGGSDDHKAGVAEDALGSPIGDPTTLVFAKELSVAGILAGVRSGRTVVKLLGPTSAMVELSASVSPAEGKSRIVAPKATITAHVVGGVGKSFRFVQNGVATEPVEITTDPFDQTTEIVSTVGKEARIRAEVLKGQRRETLTSHLFLRDDPGSGGSGGAGSGGASVGGAAGAATTAAPPAADDGSCAISPTAGRSLYTLGLTLVAGAFLLLRRRTR